MCKQVSRNVTKSDTKCNKKDPPILMILGYPILGISKRYHFTPPPPTPPPPYPLGRGVPHFLKHRYCTTLHTHCTRAWGTYMLGVYPFTQWGKPCATCLPFTPRGQNVQIHQYRGIPIWLHSGSKYPQNRAKMGVKWGSKIGFLCVFWHFGDAFGSIPVQK